MVITLLITQVMIGDEVGADSNRVDWEARKQLILKIIE